MATDIRYSFEVIKKLDSLSVFGNPKDKKELKISYRNLLKIYHPDKHAEDQELANEVCSYLNDIYERAVYVLEGGASSLDFNVNVKIGRRQVVFNKITHEGDLFIIARSGKHCLKIVKDPSDNDLLDAEISSLNILKSNDHFRKYITKSRNRVFIDFDGSNRLAHYYEWSEGYTLEEVKRAHPNLDPRHSTWMMNRLLEILSFSHSKGIAHMSVQPRHFLIIPETHGGILIDWSLSTKSRPVAITNTTKGIEYPSWVRKKPDDVRHADVIMAFKTYRWLCSGSKIPFDIEKFIARVERGSYRNRDTYKIYESFQKVVNQTWERKFLKFKM